MSHTYTRLLYHIVFSTKERRPLIRDEWRPRLHSWLGGVVRKLDGVALDIGGVADHVHLLEPSALRLANSRSLCLPEVA